MSATPTNSVWKFLGPRSRQTYSVSGYHSDAAGVSVKFNLAAKADANSPDYWQPPEPVILVDIALTTDTIDCKYLQLVRNGQPTGDMLTTTAQLVSVQNRQPLSIWFAPTLRVGAYQRA
jgi:hypothetical protein